MKRQLRLGLPIAFTNTLNSSLLFVSLMFVGHLSDSERVFAGTALATSFAFVTGFSLLVRIHLLYPALCFAPSTRTLLMASLCIDLQLTSYRHEARQPICTTYSCGGFRCDLWTTRCIYITVMKYVRERKNCEIWSIILLSKYYL